MTDSKNSIPQSLDELNFRVECKEISKSNFNSLLATFEKAQDAFLRRQDFETAYVLFMRCFLICKNIHQTSSNSASCTSPKSTSKTKKIQCNPDQLRHIAENSVENATKIADILDARYKQYIHELERSSESTVTPCLENHALVPYDTSSKKDGLSSNTNFKEDVQPHNTTSNRCSPPVIQCSELYCLLENPNLLIVDLRPDDDFRKNHINHQPTVNIPADTLQTDLSFHQLAKFASTQLSAPIIGEHGKLHTEMPINMIHKFNHIVLIDLSSNSDSLCPQTGLLIVYHALTKFFAGPPLRCLPRMLEGGFFNWVFYYPLTLSNPLRGSPLNALTPSSLINETEIPRFPSLNEEKSFVMKPPVHSSPLPSHRNNLDTSINQMSTKMDSKLATTPQMLKSISNERSSSSGNICRKPLTLLVNDHPVSPPFSNAQLNTNERKNPEPLLQDFCDKSVSPNEHLRTPIANDFPLRSFSVEAPKRSSSCKPTSVTDSPIVDRTRKLYSPVSLKLAATNRAGLRNLGNTCFLNSVVQCLCSIPPFIEYFTKDTFLRDFDNEHCDGNRSLPLVFSRLVKQMFKDNSVSDVVGGSLESLQRQVRSNSINPFEFRRAICAVQPFFNDGKQHDAMEFMLFLLDGLHESLNRTSNTTNTNKIAARTAVEAWTQHRLKNDSIIVDLFQGMLQSTIKGVHACGHQSTTFDVFMYLSLAITDGTTTLDKCLKAFLESEHLSGDSRWKCDNCNRLTDAVKEIRLVDLPAILIVHLKRYDYERNDKVRLLIDFPMDNFRVCCNDSSNRANANTQQTRGGASRYSADSCLYRLLAVCNHYGSMNGGHYTAYCRCNQTGRWYLYDDNQVREIAPQNVVTSSAYVLLYMRK